MLTPVRGRTRAARATVLGGTSLLLAASAHLIGGGRLPSPAVLLVTAGVLGLIAVTLTARRCRFPALTGVLAVQQVLLHLLFGAASTVSGCAAAMAGMHHHTAVTAHLLSCSPGPSTMASMSTPAWPMWVGHLVATLLTAWVLARGEAWLWRVVDRAIEVAFRHPARLRSRRAEPAVSPEPENLVALRSWSVAGPRGPPRVSTLG